MDPHVWQVMVDAFPQLLFKGITVTIPLTIISFALSMVIAVVVALIQYSKVPVLRQICRFYVWVIRGTPLLVQLYVVLPQAFRTAFPALGNSMISMVKDTSLAANITVAEMFFQAQRIAGRTYETMAVYIEVALIYLIFSTILEYLQRRGEKKLGKYGTN